MTRGLHPHTRLQRAETHESDWTLADPDKPLEFQEPPPRAVAKGLAAVFLALILSMAGVAGLLALLEKRTAIGADRAAAHFRTAGPPLLPDPRTALERERAAHPEPVGIEEAMGAVSAEGWGETELPPSRAEIALDRTKANQ